MKIPPFSLQPRLRGACFGPAVALFLVLGACASDAPPASVQVQPSSPEVPGAPIPLAEDPVTPDGIGSPGLPGPLATPTDDEGPGATETNVLRLPCTADSDCGDGRRCVGAGPADAGSSSPGDAGSAGDAGDSGPAAPAPIGLGRCEPVGGG